jgi:leucyl aminopeptidase
MDYSVSLQSIETITSPCILLGVYQKRKLSPSGLIVNERLEGVLDALLKRDAFDGKPGDLLLIPHTGVSGIDRVILIGLGKKGELSETGYRKILLAAAKGLLQSNAESAVSCLHEVEVGKRSTAWKTAQFVEGLESLRYRFTQMKSEAPEIKTHCKAVVFTATDPSSKGAIDQSLKEARAIAHGVNIAKDLGNLPGNICTPVYLAERSLEIGKQHKKLKIKIFDEAEIEGMGMGAFYSVSKGSQEPARFIVMEYSGASAKTKPHVLIGKGLTFDAGGISIKPSQGMDEMKYDMCGGASVIAALATVAELQLPLNVVGLIPASENLPSGSANKPGDIVKSMAGLTIEILNTDAEGRLILCDAMQFAKRYEPQSVIDVATLTGACIVALGRHPSGLWSNDDDLAASLTQAGDEACDRVWRMPLWDEYQDQLKSNFADMANIGGPDAGSVTAACFLSRFAKEYKWAHIDIAGTAWKTGAEKGATGRPVPLLVRYLINLAS